MARTAWCHAGASLQRQHAEDSRTVLQLAVAGGDLPTVEYLLSVTHVGTPSLASPTAGW